MRYFVLGISHNECPVEIRERLHFTENELATVLSEIKHDPAITELVILSTCNRVEWYGLQENTASVPSAEEVIFRLNEQTHHIQREVYRPYLYTYEGKEAIRHLFRVASGLDSLVVGENEILGQLREAFRVANEAGSVHSLVYRLMEKALKVGKDVRHETKINEGAVSVPSVAVELAEKIFGRLAGEKVMVLGTGEMSTLTLKNLKQAGAAILHIVSRNQERGEKLARQFDAQWVAVDAWVPHLESVDILIASTKSAGPMVLYEHVKRVMQARRHRPLFLIDIAVPRDIEAHVNSIDNVYLYNIDDLKGVAAANLRLRRREIEAAEDLVERAVLDYQGWLERLKARPTMERFEQFLDTILEKELARFAQEMGLEPAESKAREIRDRIRAKLLHPPLEKIKEASENGGVTRYLEALHSLFNLEERQKREERREKL